MHSTVDPQDTLATLKAAERWLDDHDHWTIRTWWTNADDIGSLVDVEDIQRVCRTCLDGAFFYVCGRTPGLEILPAYKAIERAVGMDPIKLNGMGYYKMMTGLRQTIETLEHEQTS